MIVPFLRGPSVFQLRGQQKLTRTCVYTEVERERERAREREREREMCVRVRPQNGTLILAAAHLEAWSLSRIHLLVAPEARQCPDVAGGIAMKVWVAEKSPAV